MQSSNLGTLTQELMGILVPDDLSDVSEVLQQIGWKRTGAAMLLLSVYKKACGGDVSAAKLIREMNDETSSDETSVDARNMTDAMLYRMLENESIAPGYVQPQNQDTAVGCLPLRGGGASPQTGVGEVARAQ